MIPKNNSLYQKDFALLTNNKKKWTHDYNRYEQNNIFHKKKKIINQLI